MTGPPELRPIDVPSVAALPATPATEVRQRWRLTYAREPVGADRVGRVALDEWHACIVASGLPLAMQDHEGRRPRIAFGPPLPAAATGEAELADLWLVDRLPRWRVRDALEPTLPRDHRWIGAEDVWLGAPALAGDVVAADWVVDVAAATDGRTPDPGRLQAGIDRLLGAAAIERIRTKGGIDRPYDLRPLIADVRILDAQRLQLSMRTRFDSERGAGRPEEVVAALGAVLEGELRVLSLRRKRLLLAHDEPRADGVVRRPLPPVDRRAAAGRRRPRT